MATKRPHQIAASWIFGGMFALFLMAIVLFGPEELPAYKHRIVSFLSSIMAGLFTYFLTGSVKLLPQKITEKIPKKIPVRATGGIAVFLVSLGWWQSSLAPVKIQEVIHPNDVTAKIVVSPLRDPDVLSTGVISALLAENTTLTLTLGEAGTRRDNVNWRKVYVTGGTVHERITSDKQTIHIKSYPTVDGTGTEVVHDFESFTGQLSFFQNPENWSQGSVVTEARGKAQSQMFLKMEASDFDKTQFKELHGITDTTLTQWLDSDYSCKPLPFFALLTIYLKGVPVAKAGGIPAHVMEHDEDVSRTIILPFPSARLSYKQRR